MLRPAGCQHLAGLLAAMGLAAFRAYMVFLVTIKVKIYYKENGYTGCLIIRSLASNFSITLYIGKIYDCMKQF
jgi:hypothetical protein